MKKNIIIVGGSGLLGSSICKELKFKGYNVINLDLKKNINLEYNFKSDVNDFKRFNLQINKIFKKFKNIAGAVVVYYPKRIKTKKFINQNIDNIILNIENHIRGYLNTNQILCKNFLKQKKGHIINFSSMYGSKLPINEIYKKTEIQETPLDYILSKSIINKFTKYMSKEFKKNNIRFNLISPGGIYDNHSKKFVKNYTKLTHSNKMLDPTCIAKLTEFLLNENSKFISSQNIVIDDGFSI